MDKTSDRHAADQPDALMLELVRQLATELRRQSGVATVRLDSLLERDLGFDSLARVELLARIEQAFGVGLPEQALVTAETPRDLLRAVQGCTKVTSAKATSATQAPLLAQWALAQPGIAQPDKVQPVIAGEAQAAPDTTDNLVALLDWHVRAHPDRPHITVNEASLTSGEEQEETLSYAALQEGARNVAAGLRAHDVQPGQAVAIMLPTSREYFFCFYGILLAGAIPVPIYPPLRASQIEEHLRRHARILANARATLLITVPEARPLAQLLRAQTPDLRHVVTVAELSTTVVNPTELEQIGGAIRTQDIAFLQYTSGSTGNPKGVILTH
ncbi:MAG: AMP-binding protein, partial [Pseudomonadota bacterium]